MALCCLLGIEAELASAFILGFILDAIPGSAEEYQGQMSSLFANELTTILLVTIVAPVIEELIFRLIILSLSRKFLPFFAANIIQAALFGIYHMNPVQGIYAFLLGLFIGYIAKCTGSVIPCMCFHIVFNITGLLLDDFVPATLHIAVKILIVIAALVGVSQGTYLLTHLDKDNSR